MNKIYKTLYFNIALLLVIIGVAFVIGYIMIINFSQETSAAEEEDETPPKIYNVQIESLTATTATIVWETDEDADSLINYGLDKKYGIIRDPRADKIEHKIIVEDLLPDKDYFFRITSTDEEGNQGISSDYSFVTPVDPEELEREGFQEDLSDIGDAGLNPEGVQEILEAIEKVTEESALEKIQEKIQEQAEEEVKPPTIILDYADVEVGTDWAIITWATDKESNSIVALADSEDYDENDTDPYTWREGNPDELVLGHRVEVNGLRPATDYHFQVSSESVLGLTGRSTDKTFRTKSILPVISNLQVTKVQEESATIRWTTNVPCSAIVEYTNLNNADTKLEGTNAYVTVHSVKLTNLIFDTYYSVIVRVESEDGEKAESEPLTFITTRDEVAPEISKVTTESTIYPGSDNKIQTIASWRTDELAKCQLFYHQGLVTVDEPLNLPIEEDYGAKHVEVITNFLPSSVYKFWIVCEDEAGNSKKSEDFTMLTPTQEESIIDIILKNFESSFGWVKNMGI